MTANMMLLARLKVVQKRAHESLKALKVRKMATVKIEGYEA